MKTGNENYEEEKEKDKMKDEKRPEKKEEPLDHNRGTWHSSTC